MNIMAISSSICSLEVNCAATLRRFKQDGHNVHIIVVVDEGSAAIKSARSGIGGEQGVLEHQETIVAADLNTTTFVRKPLSEPTEARSIMSDLPEPQFVTQFDYSAVTQKNADILAEYRSEIRPALVIMPFWKSEDEKERVLARSTLIACRGIGSGSADNDG